MKATNALTTPAAPPVIGDALILALAAAYRDAGEAAHAFDVKNLNVKDDTGLSIRMESRLRAHNFRRDAIEDAIACIPADGLPGVMVQLEVLSLKNESGPPHDKDETSGTFREVMINSALWSVYRVVSRLTGRTADGGRRYRGHGAVGRHTARRRGYRDCRASGVASGAHGEREGDSMSTDPANIRTPPDSLDGLTALIERMRQIADTSRDSLFLSDAPPHPDFELLGLCADAMHWRRKHAALRTARLAAQDAQKPGRGWTDDFRAENDAMFVEERACDAAVGRQVMRAKKLRAMTPAGIYAKALIVKSSKTGAAHLAMSLAEDLIACPGLRKTLWPAEGSGS